MTDEDQQDGTGDAPVPPSSDTPKTLSPEAERALAEAAARREASRAGTSDVPTEMGGRKGPEPTRFGDWEKKGIICDF